MLADGEKSSTYKTLNWRRSNHYASFDLTDESFYLAFHDYYIFDSWDGWIFGSTSAFLNWSQHIDLEFYSIC